MTATKSPLNSSDEWLGGGAVSVSVCPLILCSVACANLDMANMLNTNSTRNIKTIPMPSSIRFTPESNRSVIGIFLANSQIWIHIYVSTAHTVKQHQHQISSITLCFDCGNNSLFRISMIIIAGFNTQPIFIDIIYACINHHP